MALCIIIIIIAFVIATHIAAIAVENVSEQELCRRQRIAHASARLSFQCQPVSTHCGCHTYYEAMHTPHSHTNTNTHKYIAIHSLWQLKSLSCALKIEDAAWRIPTITTDPLGVALRCLRLLPFANSPLLCSMFYVSIIYFSFVELALLLQSLT